MTTFIQVLLGLTEVLTILQCSFMSLYTNSQIYSLRNIFLTTSQFLHRTGLPTHRSSACSADSADVELVSQHACYLEYLQILSFGYSVLLGSVSAREFSPNAFTLEVGVEFVREVLLSSVRS